jgi:hypothetical protein
MEDEDAFAQGFDAGYDRGAAAALELVREGYAPEIAQFILEAALAQGLPNEPGSARKGMSTAIYRK